MCGYGVLRSILVGAAVTLRNVAFESLFGLKWGEYGRYPTVVLKEKREALKAPIVEPGDGTRCHARLRTDVRDQDPGLRARDHGRVGQVRPPRCAVPRPAIRGGSADPGGVQRGRIGDSIQGTARRIRCRAALDQKGRLGDLAIPARRAAC